MSNQANGKKEIPIRVNHPDVPTCMNTIIASLNELPPGKTQRIIVDVAHTCLLYPLKAGVRDIVIEVIHRQFGWLLYQIVLEGESARCVLLEHKCKSKQNDNVPPLEYFQLKELLLQCKEIKSINSKTDKG